MIPFNLKLPSFLPFGSKGNNSSKEVTERRIRANDHEYNAEFSYAGNYIRTSKYSILTFVPINLFEQFQRAANLYFLLQIIIMSIPQLTALNPLSTVIPLLFVLLATAVKDAYDDYGRHSSDNRVNNRLAQVVCDGKVVLKKWHNIGVGDVIKIASDEAVTADVMLLSTSEPNGLCYIETAELDGETNLKVRQPLTKTAELGDDVPALSKFDAEVVCEAPNNVLDKFEGTLHWHEEKHAIDNNNIVLRGCWVRNTDWIFGVVVFAGHDTKLMMNSGATTFKRTRLDREMNVLVIGIASLLMVICTFLSIMSYFWEKNTGDGFQVFIPWPSYYKNSPGLIALFHWPAFIMVLNTLIPISLYISVEIIRLGQSLLINWDGKMYHEETDTPARARNTTLNEELGQIQYIFSDKTGTLTQNMMTFKECSIGGKVYGHMIEDEDGNVRLESLDEEDQIDAPGGSLTAVDFSENVYADPNFVFYDNKLLKTISSGEKNVSEFFKLIALCHTVMIEEKEAEAVDADEVDYIPCGKGQGKVPIEYQAQSPDEGALVSAARNFGFVFKHRTPNTVTILNRGEEEVYELLAILDFNNVRKRMSVLVRKDGKVTLYCKGADTIMYELLSPACAKEMDTTQEHLDLFACSGLRTLCLAYRDIDDKEFTDWWAKYHEASIAIDDREQKVSDVYELIEKDMVLLGATAIEDKLQDGVPETIANLAQSDIKIWVLTGDKQETAINIGYSCMLLTEDLIDVFILNGTDAQTVKKQMSTFMSKIKEQYSMDDGMNMKDGSSVIPLRPSKKDSAGLRFNDEVYVADNVGVKEGFGLVVTGKSLGFALHEDVEQDFLALGKACKAVICCRVTPLQKALVVDLVKRHVKAVTLAIGDGANDVSMIKAAHIGVGISGQEGMQAVLASDHSIAQFRFLERLVLVHGRWSYLRMCKFLNYFFYKNFAFTLVQFWFNLFNGFSAQTLYDTWFMSFYNVTFTSLPVLALGIMDQDVSEKNCVDYPKLYLPGPQNILFNRKTFALKLLHGAVTSLLLYFIPYGILSNQVNDDGLDVGEIKFMATTVACTLVVLVNLQISLDTSHWTWINHFFIWGSITFYFIFTFTLYSPGFSSLAPGVFTFSGMAVNVFGSGLFWFSLVLTLVVCLLPVIGYRWSTGKLQPSLSDLVRRGEWKERRNVGRSTVSLRRSRRSLRSRQKSARSSYAFSHQQGFGDLITSGRWLPKFKFRTSKSINLSP